MIPNGKPTAEFDIIRTAVMDHGGFFVPESRGKAYFFQSKTVSGGNDILPF